MTPTLAPPAHPWWGWRRLKPPYRCRVHTAGWRRCPEADADTPGECCARLLALTRGTTDEACCLARGAHPGGSDRAPPPDTVPGPRRRSTDLAPRVLWVLAAGGWVSGTDVARRLGLPPGNPSLAMALLRLTRRGQVLRRGSPGPGRPYEYAAAPCPPPHPRRVRHALAPPVLGALAGRGWVPRLALALACGLPPGSSSLSGTLAALVRAGKIVRREAPVRKCCRGSGWVEYALAEGVTP